MKSIAGIDMGLGSIKVVALDRVGEVTSLMAIESKNSKPGLDEK